MRLAQLTSKHLLLFAAIVSAAVLGGALIGQYFFGLYPCHLCLLQRYPHAAVIMLGLVGAWFIKNVQMQQRLLMLCCLCLLIGAGIASYHAGVELGIFKGPDGCTANASGNATLEELRAQIAGAALVSCSEAMAYIFGLSMAAWNALLSVGTVLGISYVMWRQKYVARKS